MALISGTYTTTSTAQVLTTSVPLNSARYRLHVYSSAAVGSVYPTIVPTGFTVPAGVVCNVGLIDMNTVQVAFTSGTFSYWADPA